MVGNFFFRTYRVLLEIVISVVLFVLYNLCCYLNYPVVYICVKRLLMLKHNCKRLLIKQNYKEKCLKLNTWYTISGAHNTNQIQTLKTLEFLRYELWWEILSELLMQNNFDRVLALSNCCWVSHNSPSLHSFI